MIMRGVRAAVVAACFGFSLALSPSGEAVAAAPPSVEELLASPAFSGAELSPSGRYVAFLHHTDTHRTVAVYDYETGKTHAAATVPKEEGYYFEWVDWKTDDRLLVGTTLFSITRNSWRYARTVLAMNRDGSKVIGLFNDAEGTSRRARAVSALLDRLGSDPDHVLMVGSKGGAMSVWRSNVHTGQAELIEQGTQNTSSWSVDRNGAVVARIDTRGDARRGWLAIYGRAPGETEWTEVVKMRPKDFREAPDFEIVGPADDPGQVYVLVKPASGGDADTSALHVYDFKTKQLSAPVRRHPKYDITTVVYDGDSTRLAGFCYVADVHQCDFDDKKVAATFRGLSKYFGGDRDIVPVSISDDGEFWLLHVSGADEPGAYYLYDWNAREVAPIGSQFPKLTPDRLGRMKPFAYKARDGLEIGGYVTRPAEPASGPRPLVVLPHGGPEVRDRLGYGAWTQYFASRGYLVFQPNFRGSGGFGRKYAEAGYGQWGERMQDDVYDGVQALIASGEVDPNRICIVGASYGGYVALWGAVDRPELLKCVVSVAGVTDLQELMEWERRIFGADSSRYEYWVKSIGDPKTQRAELEAKSPARFAAKAAAPVLLIHGDADWIVPVDQSRRMEKALRKAGRTVTLTVLEGEGHDDWSSENDEKVLTQIGAFVEKHLGAAAPVAAAAQAAP